jgi:hypothetical protein
MSLLKDLYQSHRSLLAVIFLAIWIFVTSETMYLYFAHGQSQEDNDNQDQTITIHPRSMEELKMIQQYCFDHADKILNGKNPINDLIATGLIELSEYLGTTCDEIPDYIEQAQDQLRDK